MMSDKILFVDDEPAVLSAYKRILHREFEVHTAAGGELGLESIRDHGPYGVVISDMRMPVMNGAQFLSRVREAAPDTVRMLLTGHSDLNAAMDAVNEGNIFRFLTKPCEKDVLGKAITDGLKQYRLVRAEKELLENTLMGSIKVLADVLGAVSPEAFGRSMRITHCMRHLVSKFSPSSPWCFEAAAMLSQLGCVALDPEIMQAACVGTQLSSEDQARFEKHPEVARDLLANIPRLEPVAWMISQQLAGEVSHDVPEVPLLTSQAMVMGAKMLRLAVSFDNLRLRGLSHESAISRLRYRSSEFGHELVAALADIKPEEARMELRKISVSILAPGMILQQEIRNNLGMLVVAKGQEVTPALHIKLVNFRTAGAIDKEIMVLVPE